MPVCEARWKEPFTSIHAEYTAFGTCERDKGATAAPLSIPAAPREIGASHCAHLPTGCLRSARLDVLSRFASGRHPWHPALVLRPPARRFQRGLNTSAIFRRLRRLKG